MQGKGVLANAPWSHQEDGSFLTCITPCRDVGGAGACHGGHGPAEQPSLLQDYQLLPAASPGVYCSHAGQQRQQEPPQHDRRCPHPRPPSPALPAAPRLQRQAGENGHGVRPDALSPSPKFWTVPALSRATTYRTCGSVQVRLESVGAGFGAGQSRPAGGQAAAEHRVCLPRKAHTVEVLHHGQLHAAHPDTRALGSHGQAAHGSHVPPAAPPPGPPEERGCLLLHLRATWRPRLGHGAAPPAQTSLQIRDPRRALGLQSLTPCSLHLCGSLLPGRGGGHRRVGADGRSGLSFGVPFP